MALILAATFRGAEALATTVFTALRDAGEQTISPEPSGTDKDAAAILKRSQAMENIDLLIGAIKVNAYITYVSRLGADEGHQLQSTLRFWTSRPDNQAYCDLATLSAAELIAKYPKGLFDGGVNVERMRTLVAMRNAMSVDTKSDLLAGFIEEEKKLISPQQLAALPERLDDAQFISTLATNYAVFAIGRATGAIAGIDDVRPIMSGIACMRNIRTWAIGWKPLTDDMSGIDYNFLGMRRETAVKSLKALNVAVTTLRGVPTRSGAMYQDILSKPSVDIG